MTVALREESSKPVAEETGVLPVKVAVPGGGNGELVLSREQVPAVDSALTGDLTPAGDCTIAAHELIPAGPVHCGANMAISAGPADDSMQWITVEPVWPEWACDCGFRMDMDALDPVSSVWLAAVRRQGLQRELAVAQGTLELAFRKAVESGVEPRELARMSGVPAREIEGLLAISYPGV
ncbi:hypothetical protein AB0N65_20305 [Paenarthrobacter sp. NPDC089322]|uniref:hypothetical protein n=1 Tax=Paenarthrobacter sp. NPDC089322 TaxID=3155065 RepID=UPI00341C980E